MDNQITPGLLKAMYPNNFTAESQFKHLIAKIKEFEKTLDEEHEVAVMLASFGQNTTMLVHRISFCNPNLIIFDGIVAGGPATLVQHISQMNFLMFAEKKQVLECPPHRVEIGFH